MEENLIISSIDVSNWIKRQKSKPILPTTKEIFALSEDPFCLGTLLLDGKIIDVRQREKSLEIHRKKGLLQGECLIRMGAVTKGILGKVLTFQGNVRSFIHKAHIHKRLKLGQLLRVTEMVSAKDLKKAISLQRSSKMLLGEILVGIGAISRNILSLALSVQKKILILTVIALISGTLVGCATLSPGHFDHGGTSTKATPYDKRYKKVRKYLETASEFRYKADGVGADYWQLPFETEKLGTGDCEDKAIWLYSRLLKEGFDNVRLVLGNYRRNKSSVHMWVNWYHDGRVYILDPTINDGIWRAEEYSKGFYKPLYSFYKDKKWKHSF